MPYHIRDIDLNNDHDVQRLADMFNDFDSAWPGGFNREHRDTIATVRGRLQRSRRAAVLAVESDGEFVGYCDLKPFPGARDMVYVDLLGARLSHHGRGVGKMLLLEMVRRACEMGARQVTLDTWAGNTKAVPLYKRTGFQWKPDSDVHMQNYMPTILASPWGRQFFDGADWYACHERDTALTPDDERWNGMPVYVYRFRRNGRRLQVWIDRASGKVTGVETDRWLVGCRVSAEEVAAGEACPIEWVVARRGGEPADVTISCASPPEVSAPPDERCRIEGERTFAGSLRVQPGARHWREGEDPHLLHTAVALDGETIHLTTGVKVVEPIEVQFGGAGLRVGRRERVTVRLRNRLDRDVAGEIALPPHPDLECEPARAPFDLPARSWTDCELTVAARRPGVHEGALALEAEGVRMNRPVALRAFAGGETLASLDAEHDEVAVLENSALRVAAGLRGGWVSVTDAASGRLLLSVGEAELGPPFCSWRLEPRLWTCRIEHGAGGPCLVICRDSDEIEGLRIERRISIGGACAVRLDHRIVNLGPVDAPAAILVAPEAKLWGTFACRAGQTLLREPMHGWGQYPTAFHDVVSEGGSLDEAWSSVEADGLVCGAAWEGSPEQKHGWDSPLPSLTYELPVIRSGEDADAPAVYLLGGPGDWRAVREWWRTTIAPSDPKPAEPQTPRRLVALETLPSPALLGAGESRVQFSLSCMRGHASAASAALSCRGANVLPADVATDDVHRGQPLRFDAEVSGPDGAFAAVVSAAVRTDGMLARLDVPVLRLASGGAVAVTEQGDRIAVDNGRLRFECAPAFGGSVVSLIVDGDERLRTSYPEARPFSWANPWYGGVHLAMDWIGGPKLARETYTGKPVDRVGSRGTPWRGVRVSCRPSHRDRSWFRIEADYLTAPGSPVLAVVTRWINRSGSRMRFVDDPVVAAWLAQWPAGGPECHWVRGGVRYTQMAGRFMRDAQSDSWAAVSDPDTGRAMMIVPSAPAGRACVEDFVEHGQHLGVSLPMTLEAHEERESIVWIVACQADELDAYAALSKATALP